MKEPMNADQRLAEFLSEEPIEEKDAAEDARSVEADADLGADPSRPVGVRSRPRGSSALRIDRPDARLIALLEAMARRIRRQPLAALAFAVGAGFMLGGALSSRTGRAVVSAAARHLGRELLKQLL